MSNKATSIYFFAFAILYAVYILVFVKHGIDITNSIITIGSLLVSVYFYLKYKKEG